MGTNHLDQSLSLSSLDFFVAYLSFEKKIFAFDILIIKFK